MKFKYYLSSSSGWAEISIQHKEIYLIYGIEYCLCDSLKELIRSLLGFIEYDKHSNIMYNYYERYCEAGYFIWKISEGPREIWLTFQKSKKKELVNLEIVEKTYDGDNCSFREEVNLYKFIDDVLDSCREMLQKYGIVGYYKNFWVEFPVSDYLLLKDARNGNIPTEWTKYSIENKDEDFQKTSIEAETECLKGEI